MPLFEDVPNDKKQDNGCFERAAARGDATFTVVGQDLTSPAVICEWIKLNIETAPAWKLEDALRKALLCRNNPNRKHAD